MQHSTSYIQNNTLKKYVHERFLAENERSMNENPCRNPTPVGKKAHTESEIASRSSSRCYFYLPFFANEL